MLDVGSLLFLGKRKPLNLFASVQSLRSYYISPECEDVLPREPVQHAKVEGAVLHRAPLAIDPDATQREIQLEPSRLAIDIRR